MIDTKAVSSYSSLPSKWRLDHVPDLILDIIVDCLAEDASQTHPSGWVTEMCLCESQPLIKDTVIIPLSQDLRTMSLVTHQFRENILRRKIMDTVVVHRREGVASALSKIRRESFGYIRHVIVVGLMWRQRTATLETFLQRCSAVKSIADETEEVAYLAHSFPITMSELRLRLAPGEVVPQPINAPGLRRLWVSAAQCSKTERSWSREPIDFPAKVKHLGRDVKNLDVLNLQPPGLSAPVTSKLDRLPSHLNMQDPLPKTLENIRHLSIVTDDQFCTLDKGSPREAHWWGYYSWIINTAPKITEISLTMVWTTEYLFNRDAAPYEILASMGLNTLKWDEENNVLKTRPRNERETISPDMKEFMLLLLQARPELETITLSHDLRVASRCQLPCPFRRAVASRSESHGGQETVVLNDRIDYDLVDRTVQEFINGSPEDDTSDASGGSVISY